MSIRNNYEDLSISYRLTSITIVLYSIHYFQVNRVHAMKSNTTQYDGNILIPTWWIIIIFSTITYCYIFIKSFYIYTYCRYFYTICKATGNTSLSLVSTIYYHQLYRWTIIYIINTITQFSLLKSSKNSSVPTIQNNFSISRSLFSTYIIPILATTQHILRNFYWHYD